MYTSFGIPFCDLFSADAGERQMRLARAAGFAYTELQLGEELFDKRLAAAKGADIFVSAARLPSDGVSLIWERDEAWEPLHALYLSALRAAKESGISTVIASLDDGREAMLPTQNGLSHLRTLAADAEKMGICLAFENGASPECFEVAVRSCCRSYHGVCFRPAAFWIATGSSAVPSYAYKSLIALSLDDIVRGKSGYIPGDGEMDYVPLAASLAESGYGGLLFASVTREHAIYKNMKYEAFASRTYEALLRVVRMVRDRGGNL